jgi:RHS repeat-associated protein
VKNRSNSAVVEENHYNGLNQRIGWHYDVDADGDVDGSDPWYWFVQDLRWRTVATYRVPTSWSTAADSDPKERFVFHHAGLAGSGGSGYIDEVILRDRDNSGGGGWVAASDGTLEERFFHLHNWRHDVIALGKPDGTLVERVKYSAYGVATRLDPADYNGDSFIDFFDDDDFDTDYSNTNALADFDYSGTVNATDSTTWTTAYLAGNITARGALSTTNATTGVNNRAGYAGYQFSPATQQYHVRHRAYDPLVGTWGERDPMEYVDGSDLYMYVANRPIMQTDSSGLAMSGRCCRKTEVLSAMTVTYGPSFGYTCVNFSSSLAICLDCCATATTQDLLTAEERAVCAAECYRRFVPSDCFNGWQLAMSLLEPVSPRCDGPGVGQITCLSCCAKNRRIRGAINMITYQFCLCNCDNDWRRHNTPVRHRECVAQCGVYSDDELARLREVDEQCRRSCDGLPAEDSPIAQSRSFHSW